MKAIIEMENGKEMHFELFPQQAPLTTANFVRLVKSGYYDGKDFNRVVPGWVIQAGNPIEIKDEKWKDHRIVGEFAANGYDTNLTHPRGAISMARKPDDFNSGGLLFFIVHADAHKLDGKYAAFGLITQGLDVLDEIASVPTILGEPFAGGAVNRKPVEAQVIRCIRIEEEEA